MQELVSLSNARFKETKTIQHPRTEGFGTKDEREPNTESRLIQTIRKEKKRYFD